MEIQNSMYSLRKTVSGNSRFMPRKRITHGIKEKSYFKGNKIAKLTQEGVIKKLRGRKEMLEKYKKKSNNEKSEIIRKNNDRNVRKAKVKSRRAKEAKGQSKKIYNKK